jgi:hypothetical protein
MQGFINKFENFSIEILLEIFDYLSIDDCFHGFLNLNWTINSALNLSGFSIDLTSISREKFQEFYKKMIFSNHFHQIRKLKMSNDLTNDLIEKYFHSFNLYDFPQLRSLILIKPSYMILGSLALLIPDLEQLEHLSIDSNSYPENFFRLVTTTSKSMKSCYFHGLEIEEEFSFQSNIEELTIIVEDITILLNLLAVFSRLKYLNVSLRSTLYIDENSLPELNLISCENLQIFKLNFLEKSSIDLKEIEYFFKQISFHQLKSFAYNCTTRSLNHINVQLWNEIFSTSLSSIEKCHFFVQIPHNSYSFVDIQQALNDLQTNFYYSIPFSLSINSLYYIIHTNIYPKKYFDVLLKSSESEEYFNYDPLNCDIIKKFSKVNSLIVDSRSILTGTILPKNIKYLQIHGQKNDLTLDECLKDCSNQLISLKIVGLPNDLPLMPNLRQLTIQQAMFNLNMASKLSSLCPRLELLTIEIDCIKHFGEILDQLRYKSNLIELKFIRAFSRDPNQTWSSWLNETKQFVANTNYEAKNLFLFIWF